MLRELVDAPRLLPAPFGLVNSKTLVDGPGHWENGFAYGIANCGLYGKTHDYCDYGVGGVEVGPVPGSAQSLSVGRSLDYAPYLIEATDGCRSSAGATPAERKDAAREALEALTPKLVEKTFWEGGFSGGDSQANRSLRASTAIKPLGDTAVKPRRAIAALEQALADDGAGTLGAVHVTRDVLSLLKFDIGDVPHGDVMYTPGGNMLVGGVGYTGNGTSTRTTSRAWAFATGPVAVFLSGITVSDEPSKITGPAGVESFHTTNTLVYTASRMAAATFNGCNVYAVLIDLDG